MTATRIDIREGRSADADELASLLRQLGYETSAIDVRQRIEDMRASRGDKLFVAVCGPAVVGCIAVHAFDLFHRAQRLGRITALVVDERSRGQGVGRALVARAERSLTEAGCGRIEVTSNVRRLEAHAFYEALGYKMSSKRFEKTW